MLNKGRSLTNEELNDVLNDKEQSYAATLSFPQTGVQMKMYTTAPALQLYTSNHFDGSAKSPDGILSKFAAVCLEPQLPINSVNCNWPGSRIKPGGRFIQKSTYVFSAVEKSDS